MLAILTSAFSHKQTWLHDQMDPFPWPLGLKSTPARGHGLPSSAGRTLFLGRTLQGGSAVVKDTRRKLAVILAADVVGYSRLMGEIANFQNVSFPDAGTNEPVVEPL